MGPMGPTGQVKAEGGSEAVDRTRRAPVAGGQPEAVPALVRSSFGQGRITRPALLRVWAMSNMLVTRPTASCSLRPKKSRQSPQAAMSVPRQASLLEGLENLGAAAGELDPGVDEVEGVGGVVEIEQGDQEILQQQPAEFVVAAAHGLGADEDHRRAGGGPGCGRLCGAAPGVSSRAKPPSAGATLTAYPWLAARRPTFSRAAVVADQHGQRFARRGEERLRVSTTGWGHFWARQSRVFMGLSLRGNWGTFP